MRINLDDLSQHIKDNLEPIIDQFIPNAKQQGNGWRLGDIDGNKGNSLWIGETGFKDHATQESGSHLTVLAGCMGVSLIEAARIVAAKTGFKQTNDDPKHRIKPTVTFAGLEARHCDILQSRGFLESVYSQLPLATASNGALAFLHLTAKESLAFVKFYSKDSNTKWWSDAGETHHLPWLIDVVLRDFPDADTLYITEGHWDAIAAIQAGFPAISIPNGAGNHHWIDNCQQFLNSFNQLVLAYDNDAAGTEALHLASTRLTRPLRVLQMPSGCKDLNDVLLLLGGDSVRKVLENHQPYSPQQIIRADSLMERAKQGIHSSFSYSTPWGDNFKFAFRPHESTVLTAYTGAGKSSVMRQIVTHIAAVHHEQFTIASFEDTPLRFTAQTLDTLHNHPHPEKVLHRLHLLDSTHPSFCKKKIKLSDVLALFKTIYTTTGCQFFLIDNLMCLDISREDLKQQADAAEEVRQFVIELPVHLVLVAHPRKQQSNVQNTKLQAPAISEIRGAAEIADASFNILGVARNIPKEREIQKLRQLACGSQEKIHQIDLSQPDTIIECNKQRFDGNLPLLWLWRDAQGNFHGSALRDSGFYRPST